jgi:hypothetical protein
MLKILRLTILYFMLTAIAVCVTKPASATLVLSDLNGVPVLYNASKGFAFIPVFNYGDLELTTFMGTTTRRALGELFAQTIDYGGFTGWKLYVAPDFTFDGDFADITLASSYGIFGPDIDAYEYGIGIGGSSTYNDCGTIDGFLDHSCNFRSASGMAAVHAIYILYDIDKTPVLQTQVSVPIPPLLSLIGLGLLGIMSRRIKTKTI